VADHGTANVQNREWREVIWWRSGRDTAEKARKHPSMSRK
jgi:hypothetical protein